MTEFDFDVLIEQPHKVFGFCQKISTILYALSFIAALWKREAFTNFLNVLRSSGSGKAEDKGIFNFWVRLYTDLVTDLQDHFVNYSYNFSLKYVP